MSPSVRGLATDVVHRSVAVAVVVCMSVAGVAVQTQQSKATVVATDRIAVGASHTCVINNDNTVWCWGSNTLGQLGVANTVVALRSTVPVRSDSLPGGRVAVKIAAGTSHTCVLAQDNTVWCWGANGFGQSGSSTAKNFQPVQITVSTTAQGIQAGGANSCAVLTDNSLECWGRNVEGQLGNNATGNQRNE